MRNHVFLEIPTGVNASLPYPTFEMVLWHACEVAALKQSSAHIAYIGKISSKKIQLRTELSTADTACNPMVTMFLKINTV